MHFSEMLIIFLVALLVIKPERLPSIALSLGRWLRWLRQGIKKMRHELDSHE